MALRGLCHLTLAKQNAILIGFQLPFCLFAEFGVRACVE